MTPTFAVVGTGRCGTKQMSRVFGCGHESWWNVTGSRRLVGVGDSSWMALPDIEGGAWNGLAIHVVRHPVDVVRSFVGIGFFERPSPWLDFAAEHCPLIVGLDPVAAAVTWWSDWASRCARVSHMTVRIEDITARRSNQRDRADVPSEDVWGLLDDGEWWGYS